MGKDVEVGIPQPFVLHSTIGGALDLDLDNITLKGDADNPVEMRSSSTVDLGLDINNIPTIRMENTLKGDSENPVEMKSSSTVDLGLDNIRITELPQINLQLSSKPTRVHFPVNYKLSFGMLGIEFFSMNVCGESMVVIEDYFPHVTEECENRRRQS